MSDESRRAPEHGSGSSRGFAALAAVALLLGASASAKEYDCLIEPRRVVTISGSIEALITSVRVDRGDFVDKGDVLVEFESGVERASAQLARYRSEMQGAIDARKARLEFANATYERSVQLRRKNLVSSQDLEEALAEKRLAEAELREAQDDRKLAEFDYRRQNEILRLRTLISPVSGVVVDRYMNPGEISEVGVKPILKLAEIDTLYVEVILPASLYGQVAKGDLGVVRPEPPIGGKFELKVAIVDRVIDAASGTFGVRLELPNPKRVLPAGARCMVEFPAMRPERAGTRISSPASPPRPADKK